MSAVNLKKRGQTQSPLTRWVRPLFRTKLLKHRAVTDKRYRALKDAGIRFMIANRNEMLEARDDKDNYRSQFQQDTYAVMLLTRAIAKNDPTSPIYRLLSFYLKTRFNFTDEVTIDDYITAIVKNDIGRLITGILAYRPAQAYDKPDYKNVAAVLISM